MSYRNMSVGETGAGAHNHGILIKDCLNNFLIYFISFSIEMKIFIKIESNQITNIDAILNELAKNKACHGDGYWPALP